MEPKPNPRNCSTCEWATAREAVFCAAPVPLWVPTETPRIVARPDDRCDAHKVRKGTFARMCLNCGNPIRSHHKFTQIGRDQWVHKCCEHPNSWSIYHYNKYPAHRVGNYDRNPSEE